MKIHPVGHRILVKLKEADKEEVSKGGILLSTGVDQERRQKATQDALVVELGPNAYKAFDDGEPWCSAGDWVKISKYCGEDYTDEVTKEVFRILNDEDVLAVIKE